MYNPLAEKLKLSTQEQAQVGRTVGRLKSIADFLSDAVEALKDTTVVAAVGRAAPWADAFGSALSETIPPVKFAIELVKGFTEEHDPEALGFLAATLAYQRAVEQTVASMESPSNAKKAGGEIKSALREAEPSASLEMKKFSFRNANEHPFVRSADAALRLWAASVGYGEAQARMIEAGVHRRFVSNLKSVLSHGELRERFAPFTQKMELGTGEEQAYDALLEHAENQRRLFEEAPVFEKEPFALAHVYVDTECGVLKWGDISREHPLSEKDHGKGRDRLDPFSEAAGGRHPLLEKAMALIGDPALRDAIVIQGAAGSGKSSFTLRLCAELLREGLQPIRVRLRDLDLNPNRSLRETLPRALFPTDRFNSADGQGGHARPDDLFLGGSIFKESTLFRGTRICPYVLILDGWDEISISATTGFKVRVTNMLSELRSEYLRNPAVPVRVILTGRPSSAVSESKFMLEGTPVLTMRTLHPDQLARFASRLKRALEERPIKVAVRDEREVWRITDTARFDAAIGRYREEFEAATKPDEQGRTPGPDAESSGSMAVLGLPLLAHLAIRLMSKLEGRDMSALVQNPTTLYRNLVDLTCEKGGRIVGENASIGDWYLFSGAKLRDLLWKTATAMTVYGGESISFTELALRLDLDAEGLDRKVNDATEDHELSQLMVSFFFKGGQRHLGCEFLHKSFREYLFAESVVETLKSYGRSLERTPGEREPYWKEFDEADPRHGFSRRLSEALAPQWLSPEVVRHLEQLITWEIKRSREDDEPETVGNRTVPLDPQGWARVRDGLADLWDWWAEGVHLRPQLIVDRKTKVASFEKVYAQELVEQAAPFDPALRNYSLEPKRTVTMDSQLGDALFRLCAWTHYQLAVNTGWLEGRDRQTPGALPSQIWEGVSRIGKGPRRCQSLVTQGQRAWVLFAPSGEDLRYFSNYANRINSAGWRPHGHFPGGVNLSGIDLRFVRISIPMLFQSRPAVWTHANLSSCALAGSLLVDHTASEINAERVDLSSSAIHGTSFENANLWGVDLDSAVLSGVNFERANLRRAFMYGLQNFGANFSGAILEDIMGMEAGELLEASQGEQGQPPVAGGEETIRD